LRNAAEEATVSDGLKIALTALFGIGVFVAGQLLQRIVVEPLQELRKTIGKIAHALTFYANFMHYQPSPFEGGGGVGKPPEQMEEASLEIRRLASDLRAISLVIPAYRVFALLRCVPSQDKIDVASSNLIGWSNSLGRPSDEHRQKIAEALKLKIPGLFPRLMQLSTTAA
jgi:hypothetical protein